MTQSRPCETCGTIIRFIRNSRAKPVPFNVLPDGGLGACHYETCTQPPGSSLYGAPGEFRAPVVEKPLDKQQQAKERAYLMSSAADKLAFREQNHNKTLKRWVR